MKYVLAVLVLLVNVCFAGTVVGPGTNASANNVFAGPTSGAATAPGFRALVSADISGLLATRESVRVATDAAGTLSTSFENGDTVDGTVLATGDRLLIKDQVALAENGVYTVAATGTPTRATDADTATEINYGYTVFVFTGTVNGATTWTQYQSVTTIDVSSVSFWCMARIESFYKFTGPASTLKTFTLPNASATILTDNAVVTSAQGGTGVNNGGTLTNATNTTITGGGTIALGGFTATVPATGTVDLIGSAQTISARKTHTATPVFSNMVRAGTVEVIVQDGTPATRNDATALVADDLWYETDTNMLWFWNGTYWLSKTLYTANGFVSAITAGANLTMIPTEIDEAFQHDIFVVDLCTGTFVATTNTGANYWTITLARISSAAAATTISTHGTSADAADTWVIRKTAADAFIDLSAVDAKVLRVQATIGAGAPGALTGNVTLTYRLAHL